MWKQFQEPLSAAIGWREPAFAKCFIGDGCELTVPQAIFTAAFALVITLVFLYHFFVIWPKEEKQWSRDKAEFRREELERTITPIVEQLVKRELDKE